MRRKPMSHGAAKRTFNNARGMHPKNRIPTTMRGGIRL